MKLNIEKKIKVGALTYVSTKNKSNVILKEGETIAIVNFKENLNKLIYNTIVDMTTIQDNGYFILTNDQVMKLCYLYKVDRDDILQFGDKNPDGTWIFESLDTVVNGIESSRLPENMKLKESFEEISNKYTDKDGNIFGYYNGIRARFVQDKNKMLWMYDDPSHLEYFGYIENLKESQKLQEMSSDKYYYIQYNIGKSKYVVNFSDGVKTYNDGSRFFDIRIFNNKVDASNFIDDLNNKGYKYSSGPEGIRGSKVGLQESKKLKEGFNDEWDQVKLYMSSMYKKGMTIEDMVNVLFEKYGIKPTSGSYVYNLLLNFMNQKLRESSADYDARINDQKVMIQKIRDRIAILNKEPQSSTKVEKLKKLNDDIKAHENRIAEYGEMKKAATAKEQNRKKESVEPISPDLSLVSTGNYFQGKQSEYEIVYKGNIIGDIYFNMTGYKGSIKSKSGRWQIEEERSLEKVKKIIVDIFEKVRWDF